MHVYKRTRIPPPHENCQHPGCQRKASETQRALYALVASLGALSYCSPHKKIALVAHRRTSFRTSPPDTAISKRPVKQCNVCAAKGPFKRLPKRRLYWAICSECVQALSRYPRENERTIRG